MELKDIKAIIDLMKKNSITEFELEEKDSKLRLKRGFQAGAAILPPDEGYSAPIQVQAPLSMPAPVAATAAAPAAAPTSGAGEVDIKSPMIGTFYATPSPDAAPYASVGTEVSPETVVCIIEAMKVMNEIKAEVKGVITQLMVENGKPVEFGQPLFKVRPT